MALVRKEWLFRLPSLPFLFLSLPPCHSDGLAQRDFKAAAPKACLSQDSLEQSIKCLSSLGQGYPPLLWVMVCLLVRTEGGGTLALLCGASRF